MKHDDRAVKTSFTLRSSSAVHRGDNIADCDREGFFLQWLLGPLSVKVSGTLDVGIQ